jgi:photosystem II stability/assembly factor-like uncharacterized protein
MQAARSTTPSIIGMLICLQSANADEVPGRLPIWSDTVYMNSVNNLYTSGAAVGYIVGDFGLILQTKDAGRNWQTLPRFTDSRIDYVYAGSKGQVVAFTSQSYFVSFDDGARWSEFKLDNNLAFRNAEFPLDLPGVAYIVIGSPSTRVANATVTLKVTTDSGLSWHDTLLDFVPAKLRVVDAKSSWAIEGNSIYKTDDSGSSWKLITTLDVPHSEPLHSTSAVAGSLIVATAKGRVSEVTVNGANWLPKIANVSIKATRFYSDGSGEALDENGFIYTTEDFKKGPWVISETGAGTLGGAAGWPGGRFLAQLTDGEVAILQRDQPQRKTVFEFPGKPSTISAVDGGKAILATDRGILLYSTDRGNTWTRAKHDPSEHVSCLYGNPNGTALYVNGDNQPFVSKDGGTTWSEQPPFPQPTVGKVTSCYVTNSSQIIVIVDEGLAPLRKRKLFHKNVSDVAWRISANNINEVDAYNFIDDTMLAFLDDGSLVASRDFASNWTEYSADIKNSISRDPTLISSTAIGTFYIHDSKYALAGGDGGLLFITDNGGVNWTRLRLPSANVNVLRAGLFDRWNGYVYGSLVDDTGSGEYYATTSDGGITWVQREVIGSATFRAMSLALDGTGVFITDDGLNYITRIQDGPALKLDCEEAITDLMSCTVEEVNDSFDLHDIQKTTLMINVDHSVQWVAAEIDRFLVSADGRSASFTWDPVAAMAEHGIAASREGNLLGLRSLTTMRSGVTSTSVFPEFRYITWLNKYQHVLLSTTVLVGLFLFMLLTMAILYLFAPLRLIQLVKMQDGIGKFIGAFLPDAVSDVIRELLLGRILRLFAYSENVRGKWLEHYGKSLVKVNELPDRVLESFVEAEDFLDTWVAKRVDSCREHFKRERESLGVRFYVPMPVRVSGQNKSATLARPSSRDIRALVGDHKMVIEIIGDGGSGKTTLGTEICMWAMAEKDDDRLLGRSPTIVVFLRDRFDDLDSVVASQIRRVFDDEDWDGRTIDIVRKALRTRRIVVLIDGLSEVNLELQETAIRSIVMSSASFAVITGRYVFDEPSLRPSIIRPEGVNLLNANYFVSQYSAEYMTSSLTARYELAVTSRVLKIIESRFGQDEMPALFVVLLIEGTLSEKVEESSMLPVSIPEIVQRFVRSLHRGRDGSLGPDTFANIAGQIAVASVSTSFIPKDISYVEAMALAERARIQTYGIDLIQNMISSGLLVSRITAIGSTVRFRLDPVAEYLAAAVAVARARADPSDWQKHLKAVFGCAGGIYPEGYIRSLWETLRAIGGSGEGADELARTLEAECELRSHLLV